MIKSFCIKTNNEQIIDYLLANFQSIPLDNFFISVCKFKIYKNIIIHYCGNERELFIDYISKYLSKCIINFYEVNLLKRILCLNYFYFDKSEQEIILQKALNDDDFCIEDRNKLIITSLIEYISKNKSMILDGFINFRIKNYFNYLECMIDSSINNYLIEKEYIEFINLLKIYVNSQKYIEENVHLIYQNNTSILLDKNLNIIDLNDDIFKTTYLSDITFSSNDFALNSLLNLLPKNIIVHIIDSEDEFIQSLKSIFEKRIMICNDCNICSIYKKISNNNMLNKFTKK